MPNTNTQLALLIQQLVQAAQSSGASIEDIAAQLAAAFSNPGDGSVIDDQGVAWFPEGISKPDAQGLVRIKALEEAKAKFEKDGKKFAANAITRNFSTRAALSRLTAGSLQDAAVQTNTGFRTWSDAMGLAGGNLVLETVNNPALVPGSPNYNAFAPPFWIDRSSKTRKVLPDATSLPAKITTVKEAVDFVIGEASAIQKFEDERTGNWKD